MARMVFGGVMLVGRVVTFAVGLAVVMAVVLGLATAALAAAPGDPFKLGKVNTIDRLTTLAGSRTDSAMLKVDNNAEGPALALEIGNTTIPTIQTKPPMTVNSAVKVPFLNADRLDDKDHSEFLSTVPYEVDNSDLVEANTTDDVIAACDANDVALSGGANAVNDTTSLQETHRDLNNTWRIRVKTGATSDNVQAEVYCWDLPPLRQ